MDIFSVSVIGIMGSLLAVTLKKLHPEISLLIGCATGVIIMGVVCRDLYNVFNHLKSITENIGVNTLYFSIAVKACIIAYISQFCSEICRDAGENAIGIKIETAGKLSILLISIPVISGFLDSVASLLEHI